MAFLSDLKSHISPLVGYAAKNTELLHNLRFFGNFIPGYANGVRSYADDRANDRMWGIVKILFPSTGGGLSTSSSAADNFGRNLTDTKPVVALLTLTAYLRSIQREIDDLNDVAAEQFQRGDREGGRKTKLLVKLRFPTIKLIHSKFVRMFTIGGYEEMCFHILGLMANSESNLVNLGYPEFLIEQVLVGFIMVHFNGAQDYINELPKDFFVLESHPTISKIREYVIELESKMHPTAFGRFTGTIINNGNANIYDRRKNVLIDKTFPDCCETAIRHICTLLLWDAETQKIRLCANGAINEFYARYAPNDGSTPARSAWNAIVGDLNVGIDAESEPRSRLRIRYQDARPVEYNMIGSIENYALVLMRLFELETPELVKACLELKSRDNKILLERLMSRIFNLISPNKYACNFTGIVARDGIYNGTLEVTFTTNAPITFVLVGRGHGEVKIPTRKSLAPGGIAHGETPRPDFRSGEILPENVPSSYQVFRALGLPIQQGSFYARMCLNLRSNEGIINYLKTVLYFGSSVGVRVADSQTFRNVMSGFSWEDEEMSRLIEDTVIRLVRSGLHISDMKGRIRQFPISRIDDLDIMEILEIPKTGYHFLGADSCGTLTSNTKEYTKGGWYVKYSVTGRNNIVSIVVSNSLKEIGNNFMPNVGNLSTIEIPDSVTRIGKNFLAYNHKMKSIVIPSSVTSIGPGFLCQAVLSTVTIKARIETIEDDFLIGCRELRALELPDTVVKIRGNFLLACAEIDEIRLPPSLKSIGAYFMERCKFTPSMSIPKTVETIGDGFMAKCFGLEKVEISGPVRIARNFLRDCENLREVSLAGFESSVKLFKHDGTVHTYPRGTILTPANVFSNNQIPFHKLITQLFGDSEIQVVGE